MDIRLLKKHPEYKEQIKLLPTRWEKVNKIKKEEDRLRSLAAGILLSYGLRENGIDLDACQLNTGEHSSRRFWTSAAQRTSRHGYRASRIKKWHLYVSGQPRKAM